MFSKKIPFYYALPTILLTSLMAVAIVSAWTEPITTPPGGNVAAPINVSINAQSKEGALILGANSIMSTSTSLIVRYGKVGIGTMSPNAKLQLGDGTVALPADTNGSLAIINSGTSNAFAAFSIKTGGGSTVFTNAGNVGIGTTGPTSPLHVVRNFAAGPWQKMARFYDPTMVAGDSHLIHLGQSDSFNNTAEIGFGYAGAGSTSNRLFLGTQGRPETMVITAGGNVGIGTFGAGFSPLSLLHITPGFNQSLDVGQHPASLLGNDKIKGMLVTWDSDNVFLGLRDYGPDRKDTVLIFGDNKASPGKLDNFRIQFTSDDPPPAPKEVVDYLIITYQGNVGIGTTTPGAKLEVAGQIKITGGVPGAGKVLTSDATGLASWQTAAGGGFWAASGTNIYNTNTGNVGIGTTSPDEKLDVNGNIFGVQLQAHAWDGAVNKITITHDDTDGKISTNVGDIALLPAGNVGIGTTAPGSKLDVRGDISLPKTNKIILGVGGDGTGEWIQNANYGIAFYGGGQERMRVTNTGNVGIGTTSPREKLDVAGNIRSTGNRLYLEGADSVHLFWINRGLDEGGPVPNPEGDNVIGWNDASGFVGRKIFLGGTVVIGALDPTLSWSYQHDLYVSRDVFAVDNVVIGAGGWGPNPKPAGVTGQIKITGGNPKANRVLTSIDDTGLAEWKTPAPGGGIGGSGTANYISKFTGTNSIGNSQIYDNGTNVGIGTTSPTKKLEVVGGPIKATGGLIIETRTDNPSSPEDGRIWLCTDSSPYCQ